MLTTAIGTTNQTPVKDKLTKADGVQILGATYLRLCGQVCTTLADMQANHSAQGLLLRLREELYQETYGRKR